MNGHFWGAPWALRMLKQTNKQKKESWYDFIWAPKIPTVTDTATLIPSLSPLPSYPHAHISSLYSFHLPHLPFPCCLCTVGAHLEQWSSWTQQWISGSVREARFRNIPLGKSSPLIRPRCLLYQRPHSCTLPQYIQTHIHTRKQNTTQAWRSQLRCECQGLYHHNMCSWKQTHTEGYMRYMHTSGLTLLFKHVHALMHTQNAGYSAMVEIPLTSPPVGMQESFDLCVTPKSFQV